MGPRFIREIRNPRAMFGHPRYARVATARPRVSELTYEPRTHRLTYIYKWKNHFSEMKGDVGMSPHEKEGEQGDAYTKIETDS